MSQGSEEESRLSFPFFSVLSVTSVVNPLRSSPQRAQSPQRGIAKPMRLNLSGTLDHSLSPQVLDGGTVVAKFPEYRIGVLA